MTFRAKYPGRCTACDEPIEIGDRLATTEDGFHVHEACPDTFPSVQPRETCPRCWTERSVSGACACDPEDGAA